MIEKWFQISVSRRWTLLFVGILICLTVLNSLWWSSLGDDIDRLEAEIQQTEQESRAALLKLKALQDVDQQFLQIRHELLSRFQGFPDKVHPQNFRKDVMNLAKQVNVTLRSWKPEIMVGWDHHAPQFLEIDLRVEGGFYQAVSFLTVLEGLPWVQSISSIHVVRTARSSGEFSTAMDIKIQAMTPSVFEQIKKLLAI